MLALIFLFNYNLILFAIFILFYIYQFIVPLEIADITAVRYISFLFGLTLTGIGFVVIYALSGILQMEKLVEK